MKTTNYLFCLLLTALLASCASEVGSTAGSYSYKTSGQVDVTCDLFGGEQFVEHITLPNEMGHLDVINLHTDDSLLLLFNELNGSAWQLKATLNNAEMQFSAYN